MLKIHNLGENLHGSLLVDLLLTHSSGDLQRSAIDTNDDGVGELVLIVSSLVHLNDDGLLSGVLARENDNNLSSLKTLDHLELIRIHSIEKIYTDSFKLEYIFGEKQLVQHSRAINPLMRTIL